MENLIIRTPDELQEWIAARRRYDIDFDPDLHDAWLPFLLVWVETESNGYQVVEYEHFSGDELDRLSNKLKKE